MSVRFMSRLSVCEIQFKINHFATENEARLIAYKSNYTLTSPESGKVYFQVTIFEINNSSSTDFQTLIEIDYDTDSEIAFDFVKFISPEDTRIINEKVVTARWIEGDFYVTL